MNMWLEFFFIFSQAFDTVDHAILLQKLFAYGVRGNALLWFESYLKVRGQFTTYNGVSSDIKCCNVEFLKVLFLDHFSFQFI